MSQALEDLATRLSDYLSRTWQADVGHQHIEQIPGGASRETYRIRLSVDGETRGVILRRDPPSSLIDTERALEYRTYEAAWRAGIPVPEPLLLEEDEAVLERAFSLMAEVTGCESAIANLALPEYQSVSNQIAERKWRLLGELAARDVEALGVTEFMEVPEHPARRELDYWADVIRKDALSPQPVAEATIRWLNRNLPPPSGEICLVHGDYRSGNFLYNQAGEIPALLDWEMAHIGDPLEDLAWSLDPLWGWPDRSLAGGLLPREEAIALWEEASGFKVDRTAFRWWQVFASLKGLAIWISSSEDFANGTTKEPILAIAGWMMTDRQNRILVDRLRPDTQHALTEPLA
ncbi:MAG: phosphotransferase family protein [Gammaproteobacteria bacterium]|jgi:aminoglycoside phosphotransferase (APT) family kinase protein|nr:MAG: phosphotransferase family protein [Gammaproteobacteria bacterium]